MDGAAGFLQRTLSRFAVAVAGNRPAFRKGCDFNDQGSKGHVMKPIRSWHWLAAAFLALGLASPATATTPNKHFSLGMAVTTVVTPQTDTVVTATLTNDNP